MNEELFGVINDADEVMENVNSDPFGMNTPNSCDYTGIYEGISISKNSLDNPKTVEKIKKQLKNAKRWDVVLRTIQKLNAILTWLTAGAGASATRAYKEIGRNARIISNNAAIELDVYTAQHKMGAYRETIKEYERYKKVADEAPKESDTAFKFTITVLLISIAVTVLTSLLKAAIHRKELKNISKVKGQIDKSIILYKSKMFYAASEDDRKRLEEAIKNLEEIDEMLISNKNYYMDDDIIQ